MGLFGSFFGAIGSFVSGAAGAVGRVITGAAKVAGKVLSTVARVGETVIKTVKTVWPVVKPWVQKACVFLNAIPYVGPVLSKVAGTLLALDQSPLLKKVASLAEKWLPIAGRVGDKLTNWAEIREAEEAQRQFEAAEAEMKTASEKQDLLLARILMRYKTLSSKVALKVEENDITNMESFLQLRSAQRILQRLESTKLSKKDLKIGDFNKEDLFLMTFMEDLIDGKPVSPKDAFHFTDLVEKEFGKTIYAIVFDEMIKQWAADLEVDRKKKESLTTQLNAAKNKIKNYQKQIDYGIEVSEAELNEKAKLEQNIKVLEPELQQVEKAIGHRQDYIEAAEGMLCVYEGDEYVAKVVGADNVETIKNNVDDLAELVLMCMEKGREWETLEEGEKSLINDFAIIFRNSAKARAADVLDGLGPVDIEVA